MNFTPTPSSIPPANVLLRQRPDESWAVNYTPLVRMAPAPRALAKQTLPQNPLSFLLRAALIYPDKVAVRHADVPQPVEYTYAVWAQRVQNLAYALLDAGIRPGDRVAVIAPNWCVCGAPRCCADGAHSPLIAGESASTRANDC